MIPITDDQIQPASFVDPSQVSYGPDAKHIPEGHSDVDRIANALKHIESAGNYNTPHGMGGDPAKGAYQYEPGTWKTSSTRYAQKMGLGNASLPMTREYQDAVAKNDIQEYVRQGYSP